MEEFCDFVTNFPYNLLLHPKFKSNNNLNEWKTINDLEDDNNIIIKEADKGRVVIIMDWEHHINTVLVLLCDKTSNEKISNGKRNTAFV